MKNNAEDICRFFDFLECANQLKFAMRFSAAENIHADSSAAHSWRLALAVFLLADELELAINKEHAVKIALAHDIAEAITGDVDYRRIHNGEILKEEKQKNERDAMKKIVAIAPEKTGKEIMALWEGFSREAKFVKALDKIETLAHTAEQAHDVLDCPEMIATYADKTVANFPELKPVLKELKKKLKKEFEKGKIEWKKEFDFPD